MVNTYYTATLKMINKLVIIIAIDKRRFLTG